MRKFLVPILAAALVLIMTVGVFASTGDVQKILSYNNIKITLNGSEITPKDANGNAVEPFIIDGTTYLPVRAVADAMGLDVSWNGETKTVILSDKAAAQVPAPQSSSNELYKITDVVFDYDIEEREYHAFVEVTNTSSGNLYMKSATFDFEDNNGHLLQSEKGMSSCPDIIAPGEKGYFYNSVLNTRIDDGVSFVNGFNLVPDITVIPATGSPVDYVVSDISLKDGTYGPTVTGRVMNNTDNDAGLLYVEVIYYGEDGRVIGIIGTNVSGLDSGKKSSFEISGMFLSDKVTIDTIKDYKVVARKSYMQF